MGMNEFTSKYLRELRGITVCPAEKVGLTTLSIFDRDTESAVDWRTTGRYSVRRSP